MPAAVEAGATAEEEDAAPPTGLRPLAVAGATPAGVEVAAVVGAIVATVAEGWFMEEGSMIPDMPC